MAGTLLGLFLVHLPAAAFGLSALLLKSAMLFSALKYAGAAYLLYLGIQSFRKQPSGASATARPPRLGSPFVQGFATNVRNPKIAIFILAFFPQFIELARGFVALQVFELGAIWGFAGLVALTLAASVGSGLGRLRRRSALARRIEQYATGTLFVGLGLRVALTNEYTR
jgi:threonine/homoserine/homoserine lactone efflux protein